MGIKDTDIGNLYNKAFKGLEIKPETNDWFELDSRLSKVNFLKFSFTNFNIYYAGIIVSTFLISLGIGIDYFSPDKPPTPSETKSVIQQDQVIDKEEGQMEQQKDIKDPDPAYSVKKKDTYQPKDISSPRTIKSGDIDEEKEKTNNFYSPAIPEELKNKDRPEKTTKPSEKGETSFKNEKSNNKFEPDTPVIIKQPDVIIHTTDTIKKEKKNNRRGRNNH